MARPLRIEYEGAFYHVTARGNERKRIFLSRADHEKFLSNLKDTARRFSVLIHCYVLMGNHYHLLLETPRGNLSVFMHAIQSGYTTYFNKKRNRSGHLFQGRYKSLLVDKDAYLLELSRYIHLNPVAARIVTKPEDYLYSSYRVYLAPEEESFVCRDLILSLRKGRYRSFVESGLTDQIDNPLKNTYGGMILGGKGFIRDTLTRLKDTSRKETSHRRHLVKTGDVEDIISLLSARFKITGKEVLSRLPYRNYAIYLAKRHTPLSNPELGNIFGKITYSAIAKIVSRFAARMKEDTSLRKEINGLEKKLSSVKG